MRRCVPTIELMHELFEVARTPAGGVAARSTSTCPSPRSCLDADGLIEDIIASERNVAHRLIEEFMLPANETVAEHLDGPAVPSLYRIHEASDREASRSSRTFVSTLGTHSGESRGAPPAPCRSSSRRCRAARGEAHRVR